MDLANLLGRLNAIENNQAVAEKQAAQPGMTELQKAIQPTLDFATSKGYKIDPRGNRYNFSLDFGQAAKNYEGSERTGYTLVATVLLYKDKDWGPAVDYSIFIGNEVQSALDPASDFLGVFVNNHNKIEEILSKEKLDWQQNQVDQDEDEEFREGVSQDSLFDAIQPALDFASSKGYTYKPGLGNSINFYYDLGPGRRNELVMNTKVYFDKDNEPWVNYSSKKLGVNGSDPAEEFLYVFKQFHKDVMDELGAEKAYHMGMKEDEIGEGPETFRYHAQKAKAQGKETFELGGKTHSVKEATEPCEKCGEVHTGACKEENLKECDMAPMAAGMAQAAPDRYTLSIMRGDKNLNVTTDNPAELLQLMKLAGVLQGAEEIRQEPAMEEFGNTPAATNEREPRAHGDIRDWGLPGTAKAKTRYTPAQQGDNPLESKMFEEYNKFKAGK